MFNNVALDVVIGLILVFLLYGLLVTILSEMIASWFGFRQRMLRLCIERMLNDNYYNDQHTGAWKKKWYAIKRFFLIEFEEFQFSVAGRFYAEPSIKYLAKGEKATKFSFTNGKPSYIDPDTFALTLIHMMRDKGKGDTDIIRIRYCLKYNTLLFQRETIRAIKAMLADSADDIPLFAEKLKSWFNECMKRNTGWYKRMMRVVAFFLGLGLALAFNIDSIQIARLLSRDKEARGQLVNLAVGVANDTLLANNYSNPSAPSDRSTAIIDSSLAHVSQDISLANYVLGLGWGFDRLGNPIADTIRRSTDSATYMALDDLRTGAENVESYRRALRTHLSQRRALSDYTRLEQSLNIPPTLDQKDSMLCLNDSIGKYTLLLFTDSLRSYEAIVDRVDAYTGKKFFAVGPIRSTTQSTDTLLIVHGLTRFSTWQKIGYWWNSAFRSGWLRLLGLLLTAIALSLGAPFWFDMLAKIVAIRGSGVNPTPPPQQVVITAGPVLIRIPVGPPLPPEPGLPPTPIAIAVLNCRNALAGIPGVLCIEEGLQEIAGSMVDVIEIHVLDSPTVVRITTLLGNPYQAFPLNLLITTQVSVHLHSGDLIENQILIQQPEGVHNGKGTLGCFVKKQGSSAQYLVSCWHVLKKDWNWATQDSPDLIVDGDGKKVARVVDGCLSPDLDIGFAHLDHPGGRNGFHRNWRPVTKDDVHRKMQVKFRGAHSGEIMDAAIYNSSVTIITGFLFPDGVTRVQTDLFSITRVVHGVPVAPSRRGDSGALVLDQDNVPLGILIGADDKFTYVAKLSNILAPDGIYKEYQLSI
jgi:hypothetical protein